MREADAYLAVHGRLDADDPSPYLAAGLPSPFTFAVAPVVDE